jgi:hypothetical protein
MLFLRSGIEGEGVDRRPAPNAGSSRRRGQYRKAAGVGDFINAGVEPP